MATADQTIDGRLKNAAMKQFLAHGFLDTGLGDICKDAGITTGAIYKRFKNKEDLFSSLVIDVYEDLMGLCNSLSVPNASELCDSDLLAIWDSRHADGLRLLERFYGYGNAFKMLIRCAQGTRFANFRHDFIEKLTNIYFAYLQEAQKRGLARTDINKKELHVLLTAQWESYCEPFVHDFTWDQIELHADIITRLFNWHYALGIKEPNPQN